MTAPVSDGFVPFRGMRTWYRIVGDLHHPAPGRLPLLLLHGGPGTPSDMFEPLEVLAQAGRPIIRCDQLGCGRSDRPDDPALWTIQTFVDDIGLLPVSPDAAEGLYRLVDAAYERRALVVSSNLHPAGFEELMPKTLATATVDRLLHHAHLVVTKGTQTHIGGRSGRPSW